MQLEADLLTSFVSFFRVVRLGDVDKGRSNNLNLLRLTLASAVIVSHSWVALGLLASEPVHRRVGFSDIGAIAVAGFFFISGFLILKSALRCSSAADYLRSRALRIFPGLIVAVALCVFVFGPLMTTLSLREYFSSPMTWAFLSEMWMHRMEHLLPGVCTNYPLPWLNASLWTLPGEWLMYIVAMLVCFAYRWRTLKAGGASQWIWLIVALLLTAQMLPPQWVFAVEWYRCFALGSACYLLRHRIPLWLPGPLLLWSVEYIALQHHLSGARSLFTLAICYSVLTLGFHPALHLQLSKRMGDYSYGLYIYGLPIQQLMVPHFHNPLALFLTCYPFILCVAVLSWHFVEEPALSLKHRSGPVGTSGHAVAPAP